MGHTDNGCKNLFWSLQSGWWGLLVGYMVQQYCNRGVIFLSILKIKWSDILYEVSHDNIIPGCLHSFQEAAWRYKDYPSEDVSLLSLIVFKFYFPLILYFISLLYAFLCNSLSGWLNNWLFQGWAWIWLCH